MAALPDDRVVESLQQLGLSLYEARLYLGLLTRGPQNGNELSRTSGVPSSKVYAMLERLAGDGIVARAQRGNTVEYVCVPPHELLHKLRERYSKPLDYLEETLPTIGSTGPEPDILHIQGVEAIVDNARAIIRAAQHEIYLSIWKENVEPLREDLDDADARSLRIAGMLYGGDPPDVGWWQRHSYRETVASRIRGRMLTMVADGAEALIAHMPERGEASAVRTRSPVLTLVAEEYLIHDLTLQKAKTMTGYEEWDKWLRSDDQVRMLTLGRTGHLSPIEPEVEVSS
jgi:HTH-type transcriptional regulator, sugar sensing transcriptional regulator